jgi:hypothetical protein
MYARLGAVECLRVHGGELTIGIELALELGKRPRVDQIPLCAGIPLRLTHSIDQRVCGLRRSEIFPPNLPDASNAELVKLEVGAENANTEGLTLRPQDPGREDLHLERETFPDGGARPCRPHRDALSDMA